MNLQLQSAFDRCTLPVNDRVSLESVFQLAQVCTLDGASLPVVSALCHAWLHRSRRHCSPAVCVDPVAAAVELLLPAPISGPIESWGVQPHQSSSGWMTTWRLWRTVASALHMSGILSPALANTDVTRAARLLACSFPATHACGRVVDLESCPPRI
jgi:hypothetical protein